MKGKLPPRRNPYVKALVKGDGARGGAHKSPKQYDRRRLKEENVCEHGDHPAPPGMRFCSKACQDCEHGDKFCSPECACWCGGNPGDYDGPNEYCPTHGDKA